jgi:hypothetical protein
MPSSTLRSALNDLATRFADGVLAAIRTASLDDLLAESGARSGRRAPRGGGGGESDPLRRGRGRLPRRSREQIAEALDRVVAVVKASKGKGLRAEDIRKALSLDVREVPRVLKEGLRTKSLHAKGQKRATTYFASAGSKVAPKAKARVGKKRAKTTRKK